MKLENLSNKPIFSVSQDMENDRERIQKVDFYSNELLWFTANKTKTVEQTFEVLKTNNGQF